MTLDDLPRLYFLRVGDDSLDAARAFHTKQGAVARYGRVARELAQYGQEIDASIHIARVPRELDEYPDYLLSLGPRGGVRCERA